ncbi:aminotransferase A [Pradoshia sp. D12]|uniref:aminotransferase A n=1 Tax=Bacillaceae TaxID=186817 RepID=UPI00080AF7AF|nr:MULTISPECIES: aminotransferase A [Bacillaceae]OCA89787.1 aromatic amino acid aminotransferase [Bacillus sp. FJAT-27986]QFK70815.1 aminotransferase A [Pradoshia sp. D12]TPF72606.1 aminotransferase A [Bacillus sp. D12]
MEHLINPHVKEIEISGIRQFYNMVSDIDDVLSFTIGLPDFPTPLHIKDKAINAIQKDCTTYTHNAGLLDLRQEVSKFMYSHYSLKYNPDDEILITVGASQAIDIAFRTILTPGDEVILPGPVYPGYEPLIHLAGGKAVHVDTRSTSFKLTPQLITESLTEKTKCIVLPYPSNPTGVSLTREELEEIADLVRGKNIFILADEIYSELTLDRTHTSIGSIIREQTITINGLSKSHSMTGWRIGFLMAPKAIIKHMIKVHQYNVSCASSVSQMAALEAMRNGEHDPAAMREEYKNRRDYVFNRLAAMNLQTVLPDGAFYFFIKIPDAFKNSLDFALKLVQFEKVAVIPGSAFSKYGEGYFRLSYAVSMEQLKEGLNRLEHFLIQQIK